MNQARLDEALERNPILVTALNPVIGYEKGAAIAKQAYKEGRPIREVAEQETDLSAAKLKQLLDPLELTKGGIKGDGRAGAADQSADDRRDRRRLAAPRGRTIRASGSSRTSSGVVTPELRAAARAARALLRPCSCRCRPSCRPHRAVHRARRASQGSRGPDQFSGRSDRRVGRDPGRAALREAHEEIGLEPARRRRARLARRAADRYRLLDHARRRLRRGRRFIAKPDPDEVASVFEVPLDFVLDAANIDLDPTASGSARAFAPTRSPGGYRIWGATAGFS